MSQPLETLAERMVSSRTIGFIGAGASARLGYPLWGTVIRDLHVIAREFDSTVPSPESSLDYRWLAELYGEVIRRRSRPLKDALITVFREHHQGSSPEDEEPERLHDLIARLPFRHFITTNYDVLVEKACDRVFEAVTGREPMDGEGSVPRDGRVPEAFSGFLGAFSQDTQRSVLHLHGTLEGEQLTLSMADYNEQYLQEAMLPRMFSVLATSTVVFIGASLRDADLMELIRRSKYHSGGRTRHYAFLPDDRSNEADLLRDNYGIEPIFYTVHNGSHGELDQHLEHLLELVEPLKRPIPPLPGGNARPVNVMVDDSFEVVVETAKAEVRRVRGGAARIGMAPEPLMSRLLRRVAADYRRVPSSYRFHHVVWISPGRIGLFPTPPPSAGHDLVGETSRSRSVLHSVIGEVVYSLGRHRVTGTTDPMTSIRSIRDVVDGRRWDDAQPILFVVDGFDDIVSASPAEHQAYFSELFDRLPLESASLYAVAQGDADEGAFAIDVLRDTDRDAADPPKRPPKDEVATLLDEREEGETARTSTAVLAALCLVATPIAVSDLALMLDITFGDLTDALLDLQGRGLAEGSVDSEDQASSLGVLNPIRKAVLEEDRFSPELRSVTVALLQWAEETVEGLSNWEEDNAQLDELTRQLPNVLTVFEAACWLMTKDPLAFEEATVDRHLWLGTDVAYILYIVGRWAEAEETLDYLWKRAVGRVKGTSIDDAPTPRELDTFLREVLILQSRYYEHAGHSAQDFEKAVEKAEEAIRNADGCAAGGRPEFDPGDNTFAPNRLTLARQRARAQVALAFALHRIGENDLAEQTLVEVLSGNFDGDPNGSGEVTAERLNRSAQRESRLIIADASSAIGAVRMKTLDTEPTTADLMRLFGELDAGRQAVTALNNRRARGRSAVRRGDVLLRLGNEAAARRYYARALLVAEEFRDRFLEAGAVLGLANCDYAHELAERARATYVDLGMTEKSNYAADCGFRLRHAERSGESARFPRTVVVVGIPGSGKNVAVRTAASVLAEWGYEPRLIHHDLLDRIRAGETDLDPSTIQSEVIAPVQDELRRGGERVVGIVKIPTGQLGDVFRPWMEDRDLLESMMCVRMFATPGLLRTRNAQRRSGWLNEAVLNAMIEQHEKQDPLVSLGYSTWESAFQAAGGALVSVDSGGSILALERRIRDSVALSYLPLERLADLEDAEGSTG